MAGKVMNIRVTQTKQSLVNAFLELVPRKDFDKITIADIAAGAKVNRATFYAHFNDKYELLDYMMGDSASAAIKGRTAGELKIDYNSIVQLVLAVCDYYDQPDIRCRSSYIGLVVPQWREKMLHELKTCLLDSLDGNYTEDERKLAAAFAAHTIHEGAALWVAGEIMMGKEAAAQKIALFVLNGLQAGGKGD